MLVVISNFSVYDAFIIVAIFANVVVYFNVKKYTSKLYTHFNPTDHKSGLKESNKWKLKKNTKSDRKMTQDELLEARTNMNRCYSLYLNLTSIFPLAGMLGTVWALLQTTDTIGTTDTSNFFMALTSTFWGIVAAIVFKGLDSTISYKIEDNEKHLEDLLFTE